MTLSRQVQLAIYSFISTHLRELLQELQDRADNVFDH